MTIDSNDAQRKAEARFNIKEKQASEGAKAMAEYKAAARAVEERTARLRALRLAKEADEKPAAKQKRPRAPKAG